MHRKAKILKDRLCAVLKSLLHIPDDCQTPGGAWTAEKYEGLCSRPGGVVDGCRRIVDLAPAGWNRLTDRQGTKLIQVDRIR